MDAEIALENISKKAQMVKMPEVKKIVFPQHTLTSTQPDPVTLNLRDLGLEEQLEKISRNTIKQVFGWKPSIIKSDVTKEMVDDYQEKLRNEHYTDPLTGEKFKYVPVESNVSLVQPVLLPDTTDEDIGRIQEGLKQMTARYTQGTATVERLRNAKDKLRDTFEIDVPDVNPNDPDYRRKKIASMQARTNAFNAQMREFDEDIESELQTMSSLRTNILRYERIPDLVKSNRQENQAEIDRTEKLNRGLLQTKAEELSLLNRGRLQIQQEPNETAADFKQRLIETGQATYDETEVERQAEYKTLLKLKENMKLLFTDLSLIENFLKIILPEQQYLYNRYFESIKKAFLETYGFDNKTFKAESRNDLNIIKTFFDSILEDKVTTLKTKPLNLLDDTDLLPAEPTKPEPESLRRPFPPATLRTMEVKPAKSAKSVKKDDISEDTNYLRSIGIQLPPTGGRGSGNSDDPYKMTIPELVVKYGALYENNLPKVTGQENIASRKLIPILKRPLILGLLQFIGAAKRLDGNDYKIGEGIKPKKFPKLIDFGKVLLNPANLHYQNVLSVRRKDGTGFTGFKNNNVSDDFVEIIQKMLEGKQVLNKDVKRLSKPEIELYDNLLYISGLHKSHDNTHSDTKKSMKNRLELIEGEMGAGNNNPELKKELHSLLHKMVYNKMVTQPQAMKYFKSVTK
jgi:hypothetical protein